MRLVLLGPPGAGKGTQAKLLAEDFKLPHISTGDILRVEVGLKSELGKKVAGFVRSGELVPDEIVTAVVKKRLLKEDAKGGFILDGFPRTITQAEQLNTALKKLNTPIDLVIYFQTQPQVSIKRLSGRRVCKKCGANFHLVNMPTKVFGICDFCQAELFHREDDQENTVKKRLEIYNQQTSSLIDYYTRAGKLEKVSGDLEAKQLNQILLDLFTQSNLITSDND
ncbi:adenylate kinase [Candidatus Omnitrophota bacterium]